MLRARQDEFFEFASTMVNTGPDAFFARIGRSALVNTMLLPSASYGIKKVPQRPVYIGFRPAF